MGLISGILTLPLAPVRGTVWLAERLQEQAANEIYDESAIRAELFELEEARSAGELSDEEADAAEDALLQLLIETREMEGSNGTGQ